MAGILSGSHEKAVSPVVRRRRLASELRRLRDAAHLTCEEVAERMDCSASKISRIETGRVSVTARDVRDLLGIYGVPDPQRESLIQLARESRQKGWWQAYGGGVQQHLATYLSMESEASEIRHYGVARIPMLLQTEDYARALVIAGRDQDGQYPMTADKAVEMMMERQRHARARPAEMWAALDEAALRRQVGGAEVMRAQIEHLLELSSSGPVFLQFVPFSRGGYPAIDLPFVIMSFPHPADPDVVGMGHQTGVLWIEDKDEVEQYALSFRRLQAAALSLADSASLMTAVLDEI